ncbi:MAG: hypothetical protein ABH877_00620, partial [bacterium]
MTNEPFIDDDERQLNITMGPPPLPMPTPIPAVDSPLPAAAPLVTDPSYTARQEQRPMMAWDRETPASALTGQFDAWAGEVVAVHDAGADGMLGCTQTVTVRRISYRWGANNEPVATGAPPAFSQPVVSIAAALPFPPRHDQVGYHVRAGDIVTVLSGRDERCYYLRDELPFLGKIVKASGASVKEDNVGGAGLLTLTVRRQSISGDPDGGGFAGATLADLLDAGGAVVEYGNVVVLRAPN